MRDEPTSPTLVLLSLGPTSSPPFPIAEARAPSSRPPRTDSLPFRSPGEDYDLETCARVGAERSWRGAGGYVPVTHDHTAVARSDRYWTECASAQAMEGEADLLQAYDRAFVSRLEELRGPLTAEDFAIAVGSSRPGEEPRLLALGQPALARVVREWMRRLAADPALGAATAHALASNG